jgi:hypothetical protein
MTDEDRRLLEEVRGLVAARTLLDNALADLVRDCVRANVDRSALAFALGVDRSTLYRRYVWQDDVQPNTSSSSSGVSGSETTLPPSPST